MPKKSVNILTTLSQILLCVGGVYALWQLAPYLPNFPWVKKFSATTSTDFLLRHELLQPQNENDVAPSNILRAELMQLPPEQNILLLADSKHPSTPTIRFLVAYFAFPRRVVVPPCEAPPEQKNNFDAARLGAVVIFGKPPQMAFANPAITILPGLEFRRLGGAEKWQSFCAP